MMKTVLIVDDHAIVREGLKAILQKMGFSKVQEASSGRKALELIFGNEFSAIVLDINMPGMDGIEILKQIRGHDKTVPVLVLSMYAEEHYAIRAMRHGASGYLTKDSITTELETAVQKVISGRKYISAALAEQLAETLSAETLAKPHERLTNREFQVMRLMLQGKSPSEMAEELHLSIKTISTHRVNIFEKLDLKSMVDLVRYAIRHDLFE